MAEVEFANQKYIVELSSRAYGDLEYKQRHNWGSSNRIQRERANLLFSRVQQGLYNLANGISPNEIVQTNCNNELVYAFSDNIGRIVFQLLKANDGLIIYVVDFIWDYKKDPNSWWKIVEQKRINTIIKEELNRFFKENLYTKKNCITK